MVDVDDLKETTIRKWIEKNEYVLIKNNKDSSPLWSDIRLIAHTDTPTTPVFGWIVCFCY